ncbi:MAG: Tat pathway signal protein [Verrucomicrobiae bacterium]|nr:Tat pathway signal protein [Verrucomicrobiae bacterium]
MVSTNPLPRLSPPSPPTELIALSGDRTVTLNWSDPSPTRASGYHVFRATAREGDWSKISAAPVTITAFADTSVSNRQQYFYRIRAINTAGESANSESVSVTPSPINDDEAFLELVQRTAFHYFWNEANPINGLVRDRSQPHSAASIAATGFGLTAIGIGIERGWITRAQGLARTRATLETLWRTLQGTNLSGTIGHKGWFYHFLEMETATRAGHSELSSIDTALLLAGVLYSRQYFNADNLEEKEIRDLANRIFDRVDWRWMADGGESLTLGWHPERGFIPHRWRGYNEAMILYLLGLGASKGALPPEHWRSWTKTYNWETHYGQSFVVFPPHFGHQYSHCWIDFRGIADDYLRDRGIDYFENSRRAALAQRAYAIANPGGFPGYGANVWGLTACDGPGTPGKFSYMARGGPPPENDDGTIAPTAAGASLPFTPTESLAALRHFYHQFRERIWCGYGFRDAFNLEANWWATDVIGIDQGPILLMIENHRSGHIWRVFMSGPEIQRGLRRAGFQPLHHTKPPEN